MAISLHNDSTLLSAQRNLWNFGFNKNTTLQRLSSGMRINSSGDDAAGLSISETLKKDIDGSQQASKNTQDGISMVQTAEGGLTAIQSLLQRGRDLSVQAANGVYSSNEKQSIQNEITQIIAEVQQISQSTKFNDLNLLDGSLSGGLTDLQNSIIDSLKSGWLDDAQNKIQTYFGLTPSNYNMEVYFHDDISNGALAYISSSKYADGSLAALSLHVSEQDFQPNAGDSGTNAISSSPTGMTNDMILAHELTHAVIADQIKDRPPTWFNEGCAEFLVGRDNQLKVVTNNSNPADVTGLVNAAADLVENENWNGTGAYFNYSVGYFATKFLEQKLVDNGSSLVDVFNDLKAGANLETAIANHTGYADKTAFANDIRTNGVAYYATLDLNAGIFTPETDTGSVQGIDNGGPVIAADDVIHTIGFNNNPTNFNMIFPTGNNFIQLQVGSRAGNTLDFKGSNASSQALGINAVDITVDAHDAIDKFDIAISEISNQRALLGSTKNRLDSVINNLGVRSENFISSSSSIKDTDMAAESTNLAKNQILTQSVVSLLQQAKNFNNNFIVSMFS